MLRYLIQRVAQAIVTVLAAVTIIFLLVRLSGNPAVLLAPPYATPDDVHQLSSALGLNDPLQVQYGRFLLQLSRGNLGDSFVYGVPVRDLILQALPYTAALALVAYLFASVFGVGLGTLSALRSGTWIEIAARGVAVAGQSVPAFWLGMLLILLFAVRLRILPAFGSGTPDHLILPAIALGALPLASLTRLARSATLDVLSTEHILFERSKGVSWPVFLSHVLRNTSLPIVTLSGIQLGNLLSGAVVVETLFAWPGIGQLAIQGINGRDFNVVQGVVLVATTIFVSLNLLVDLSYGWLDPRIRRQRTEVSTAHWAA